MEPEKKPQKQHHTIFLSLPLSFSLPLLSPYLYFFLHPSIFVSLLPYLVPSSISLYPHLSPSHPENIHTLSPYLSLSLSLSLSISLSLPFNSISLSTFLSLSISSPSNSITLSLCLSLYQVISPFSNASCSSNQIEVEINIYIEINAYNVRYQIGLEIDIYIEINAFNARDKIRLEINIYAKTNASYERNQIGREIQSLLLLEQFMHKCYQLSS